MTSIQSWRRVENAQDTGVVSFYTDGYEGALNVDTLPSLGADDIRAVLSGGSPETSADSGTPVYRMVRQDHWYVAIVSARSDWYPVVGQEYYLQLEGFEDLGFTAVVNSVSRGDGNLLAIFEINQPVGPLIYQRTGKALLSITLSGLSVTTKALYEQNGQMGVWLYDVPGGTFIPVEVLSNDGRNALIQPLVEGALDVGQRVLIK